MSGRLNKCGIWRHKLGLFAQCLSEVAIDYSNEYSGQRDNSWPDPKG